MKAVIAISGLAGFLLFGPNLFHRAKEHHLHVIHVDTHGADRVAAQGQDRCRFEAERSFTALAETGDRLRILAGSGSLEVEGVEGLSEVRASARACASSEDLLEDLRLTSGREGRELRVETHYPDASGWGGWGDRYARLDLRLEVPAGIETEIRDTSGEIHFSNLGTLDLEDSSGEIEGYGVLGSVRIRDSSGEITLSDVRDDVEIDDGSGEIDIAGIGGTVTIEDGSGEINVRDVGESVRVIRDGSGSIEVDRVGGDFVVERDGSGSIQYRNVTGRVDVPRKRR
jgi:hypothetical protein